MIGTLTCATPGANAVCWRLRPKQNDREPRSHRLQLFEVRSDRLRKRLGYRAQAIQR